MTINKKEILFKSREKLFGSVLVSLSLLSLSLSSNPVFTLLRDLFDLIRRASIIFMFSIYLFLLNLASSSSSSLANTKRCCFILFVSLSMMTLNCSALEQLCGEFTSSDILRNGAFDSSAIDKIQLDNQANNISDPILCIYKFVAAKNEKVLIRFNKFDIRSVAPE